MDFILSKEENEALFHFGLAVNVDARNRYLIEDLIIRANAGTASRQTQFASLLADAFDLALDEQTFPGDADLLGFGIQGVGFPGEFLGQEIEHLSGRLPVLGGQQLAGGLQMVLEAGDFLGAVIALGQISPVSYTHLTLPTNEPV